eukprot:CAMPEP_0117425100 /NCGR_PEP_ID=MMETSP0758-20121206/5411_1 /TAXON_ID=63605 /ORGANISM="Percolomonas cosmopolitus, Strain AE-1 (ATCC 50343)" /LENGTH=925 /DNA_ID=CAMNT_0005209325 /DNA_START=235 /DNA_END=3009 /DNA_ORIENTATION=+
MGKLNEKIEDLKDRVKELEKHAGIKEKETIIKEILLEKKDKGLKPMDLTGRKSASSSRHSSRSDLNDDDKSTFSEYDDNKSTMSENDDTSETNNLKPNSSLSRKSNAASAQKEVDDLLDLGPTIGLTIEEMEDLNNKMDSNENNIHRLDTKMDGVNSRLENLVEMIKKATQIGTNADRVAHQAQKQAQDAESKAIDSDIKAQEAKNAANNVAENIKSNTDRIEKLENDLFNQHKDVSEAKKLAEQAAKDSEEAKEKASGVIGDADEARHLGSEANDMAKRNSKVVLKYDERIKEIEKRIVSVSETITTIGSNAGDNEKIAELLAKAQSNMEKDNIEKRNLSTPHEEKRSPTPRGDFATRKEVQLLRQVLVKCEGDITNIMDFITALQQQATQQAEAAKTPRKSKKTSKTPRTSKTKKSKSKDGSNSARSSSSLANLLPHSSSVSGSLSARVVDPDTSKFTKTADTASNVLPRTSYNNLVSETGGSTSHSAVGPNLSRDIRSDWNQQQNASEDEDKAYNTMAITLNEVLGRTSVLEAAVTALQNLLDGLNVDDLASVRSGDSNNNYNNSNQLLTTTQEMLDKLNNNSGDTVNTDDFNKLIDKINDKCDTQIVDNLMKQVQALLSQVRTLQRQTDEKADKADVPSQKQLRDLENKLLKKVNRKELQTVITKLMPKKGSEKAASVDAATIDSKANAQASEDIEKLKAAINAHANDINNLYKAKANKTDTYKELSDMKEVLDRHDQMKADASIVARKAEREYVDNALEKLKAELENAVGQTNAHTSNLIAKDLEFLKGLLDNKASKSDVRKLRDLMKRMTSTERKTDGGLVGYRQLRCLSCNANMDNMRTKPQAMNFMNFVSHLPDAKNRLNPKRNQLVHPLTQDSLKTTHSMNKSRAMQAYSQEGSTTYPHSENIVHDQYQQDEVLPP